MIFIFNIKINNYLGPTCKKPINIFTIEFLLEKNVFEKYNKFLL